MFLLAAFLQAIQIRNIWYFIFDEYVEEWIFLTNISKSFQINISINFKCYAHIRQISQCVIIQIIDYIKQKKKQLCNLHITRIMNQIEMYAVRFTIRTYVHANQILFLLLNVIYNSYYTLVDFSCMCIASNKYLSEYAPINLSIVDISIKNIISYSQDSSGLYLRSARVSSEKHKQ